MRSWPGVSAQGALLVVDVAVRLQSRRCLLPVPSLGSLWGGETAVPRALEAPGQSLQQGCGPPVTAPLSCSCVGRLVPGSGLCSGCVSASVGFGPLPLSHVELRFRRPPLLGFRVLAWWESLQGAGTWRAERHGGCSRGSGGRGPVCPLYRGAGRRGEQVTLLEVSFGQDLKEPISLAGQRARGLRAFRGQSSDCSPASVGGARCPWSAVEARHLGVSRDCSGLRGGSPDLSHCPGEGKDLPSPEASGDWSAEGRTDTEGVKGGTRAKPPTRLCLVGMDS